MSLNAMSYGFEIFQQLGYDTSILFAHNVNGSWKQFEVSHIPYDGISGFVKVLKEAGSLTESSYPPLRIRPQRNFFSKWINRLRQYLRILNQFNTPSRQWKIEHNVIRSTTSTVDWRSLSQKQTEEIRQRAHSLNCSVNIYLLHALHNAVLSYLEKTTQHPCAWIIPAMLHESWEQAHLLGVRTSIMELNLDDTDTTQSIQQKLTLEIEQESYWGTVLAAIVNTMFPDFLNRIILKATVAKKMRVGTFTNIGKWTGRENSSEETWAIAPSVHPGQPLGVGVIEFNGKLSFGIKADPCLGFSTERINEIFAAWQERLFRDVNKDSQQ